MTVTEKEIVKVYNKIYEQLMLNGSASSTEALALTKAWAIANGKKTKK